MGLRTFYNAVDGTWNRWWTQMSVGQRLLALVIWASLLVGIYFVAALARIYYLIHAGEFID